MNDLQTLERMIFYCAQIEQYMADVPDFAHFSVSQMRIDAVAHNIEQIGEKSTKISNAIRRNAPEINWHDLSGVRNRIVHDYEGSSAKALFQIASEDILPLREKLEALLSRLKNGLTE